MENSRALHDELKQIVGETGILSEGQVADYTFDGYIPKAVVLPASVQEVQDVLRFASQKTLSVIPAGAGTKLGIGNLPQEVDIVLATTRLNSVVEYEPADLTVTVEAGIRLAALQAELAQHRQFLPLDPSYSDRCTIGGIVSANASGPLRLRHGTARNQVLGLQVVHANGTTVKSGGKVVKNVAGYDLNKLYIGAFGTLGIVTEATFKLSPIPVREAIFTAGFDNVQDAVKTGLNVVGSQMLPMFVNCLSNFEVDGAIDAKRPTLVVGFGGDPETVAWQLERCQEMMEQNGAKGVTIIEGEQRRHLHAVVQEFAANAERVIAKLNLKRTDVAEFAAQIVAEGSDRGVQVMALLGSGVLYLAIPIAADTDFQVFAKHLTELRQSVTAACGNLIVENAPPELKQHIDVWGPFGDAAGLMKQIKVRFDPKGLLNPGRFVSSI
ncbi:FAD-binding oxidoreductase [Candidatus Poribacteria bacterium]|nr:FAD-binding oxidoreductase [Candidatus Poribacteria bacterium]